VTLNTINQTLSVFSVVQVGRIQSKDVIFPDRSKALPSWILESGTAIKLNKANLNGTYMCLLCIVV